MTEEDAIQWLRGLDTDLWPPGHQNGVIHYEASREVTQEELQTVFACIEEFRLVTEMRSTNMFGGYGMMVYDNPAAPGVPLVPVLFLIENHLSKGPGSNRRQGCGRDDAWELFSRYTHSDQNKEWIKMFGLKASRERHHYDY